MSLEQNKKINLLYYVYISTHNMNFMLQNIVKSGPPNAFKTPLNF